MVDVIIPIYRQNPTVEDLISISRTFSVLKDYDITFIHPRKLNTEAYHTFENANFLAFDDVFFKNIEGYNKLMLGSFFYESFEKEYILICQTDAFIFKDDLKNWCQKNYDYIGAPWIRSKDKIPFLKLIWDKVIYNIKALINYKNNQKWQKDKSLMYNEVGNGGLSLRKREKFIEILSKLHHVVEIYLKPENKSSFYAEDVFYSIEPKRNGIDFSKPYYKEACLFAIENKQEKAINFNEGELPFGCHRWDKEKDFWRPYFAKEKYEI